MEEALERMRLAMVASAESYAKASYLDERRKIIRAQLIKKLKADGNAATICSDLAMATDQYETAVNDHYLADLDAGVKKAEADFLKIKWDTWRTKAANQRAERTA